MVGKGPGSLTTLAATLEFWRISEFERLYAKFVNRLNDTDLAADFS